jgi:hypothetical protein
MLADYEYVFNRSVSVRNQVGGIVVSRNSEEPIISDKISMTAATTRFLRLTREGP